MVENSSIICYALQRFKLRGRNNKTTCVCSWKSDLVLFFFFGIFLRLVIDDLVHYRHQLAWSVGHVIYTVQFKKKKSISYSGVLSFLKNRIIFSLFLLLVSGRLASSTPSIIAPFCSGV